MPCNGHIVTNEAVIIGAVYCWIHMARDPRGTRRYSSNWRSSGRCWGSGRLRREKRTREDSEGRGISTQPPSQCFCMLWKQKRKHMALRKHNKHIFSFHWKQDFKLKKKKQWNMMVTWLDQSRNKAPIHQEGRSQHTNCSMAQQWSHRVKRNGFILAIAS